MAGANAILAGAGVGLVVGGGSDKFWNIRLDGTSTITHWGRNGTVGQETTKRYASVAQAKTEGERLIASKLAKGYVLVRDNPASPVDTWWAQ